MSNFASIVSSEHSSRQRACVPRNRPHFHRSYPGFGTRLSLERCQSQWLTRTPLSYITPVLAIKVVCLSLSRKGAEVGDGSTYIKYRNSVILSVASLPSALMAGYLVELQSLGRKWTLAILPFTGVFTLASTTARSSNALLGFNCAYSITSSVMYGVLYAMSPELFPTKHRGTGNALVATANRIFGVMAPILALNANLETPIPIFISGGLFSVSSFLALLLPSESRGKAAL
ncbi:hypothetical protein DFH07DRAFT_941558 [Mycena maculata]|uniref:Major facilitator superfamily (MFS) profile domain-containing protein n=1 Tax=Mycena maculata TaxID=230809 RepID=A0AAD7NA96_9AGAR|nr:hypothetical protein DFH07DRAFT_941558 [Mycena maculata]